MRQYFFYDSELYGIGVLFSGMYEGPAKRDFSSYDVPGP